MPPRPGCSVAKNNAMRPNGCAAYPCGILTCKTTAAPTKTPCPRGYARTMLTVFGRRTWSACTPIATRPPLASVGATKPPTRRPTRPIVTRPPTLAPDMLHPWHQCPITCTTVWTKAKSKGGERQVTHIKMRHASFNGVGAHGPQRTGLSHPQGPHVHITHKCGHNRKLNKCVCKCAVQSEVVGDHQTLVRVPGGYIKDLKSHWSRMFAKKIAQPTTTVTTVKARGSSEPGSWLSKYVLPTKPPTKATTAAPTKALAPPMLAKKGKAPKHSLF